MENERSQMQKLYKIVTSEAKRRGYEMHSILGLSSIWPFIPNKNIYSLGLAFVEPCVHFRLVWLLMFHLLPLLLLVCIFVHIVADFINTFGGQTNAAATALHTHELSLLFFLLACLLAWYFVAATLRLCGCVFILNPYRFAYFIASIIIAQPQEKRKTCTFS